MHPLPGGMSKLPPGAFGEFYRESLGSARARVTGAQAQRPSQRPTRRSSGPKRPRALSSKIRRASERASAR